MSAISWICLLAVAKMVRWPSQKVTGLPGPLRRHSAPIAESGSRVHLVIQYQRGCQIACYARY